MKGIQRCFLVGMLGVIFILIGEFMMRIGDALDDVLCVDTNMDIVVRFFYIVFMVFATLFIVAGGDL